MSTGLAHEAAPSFDLAGKADPNAWLAGVRERKATAGTTLPAAEILADRDADGR